MQQFPESTGDDGEFGFRAVVLSECSDQMQGVQQFDQIRYGQFFR